MATHDTVGRQIYTSSLQTIFIVGHHTFARMCFHQSIWYRELLPAQYSTIPLIYPPPFYFVCTPPSDFLMCTSVSNGFFRSQLVESMERQHILCMVYELNSIPQHSSIAYCICTHPFPTHLHNTNYMTFNLLNKVNDTQGAHNYIQVLIKAAYGTYSIT